MRRSVFVLASCLLIGLGPGCNADSEPQGPDVARDAAAEAQDASTDPSVDESKSDASDASADCDVIVEAAPDSVDAPIEAEADVAVDSAADALTDAPPDTPDDVVADSSSEQTDSAAEADPDVSIDAPIEAQADVSIDAIADAAEDGLDQDGAVALDPEILVQGATDRYLLRGIVVTPDQAFAGEVLVVGNGIVCAAASCSSDPSVTGATVVDTHGMIFPGMIDAHNHIFYDVFDEMDWSPKQLYANHNQWTQEPGYQAMQDCYDYLLNSTASGGMNLDCEVLKYGEIKALLSGTTSVLGEAKGSPQACFASLARSIDGQFNGLPKTQRTGPCMDPAPDAFTQDPASADHIQAAALGVGTVDETASRANFRNCKTWSYVVHAAEGVPGNASAYDEWQSLQSKTLDVQQVSVVHGTALGLSDFQHMADRGMKLVWSPKSNMFLYGQTTRIDLARQVSPHLVIALAPDWSLGGSVNLLDELNYAHALDQQLWGGILSAQDLVKMVTSEAAKALEVQNQLGSLEAGKLADLFVVSGDTSKPYDALVSARPKDVRLVMVDGKVLYGDTALQPAASLADCEAMDVCGSSRFMCVKEPVTTSKLDQTYAQIVGLISDALTTYDAAHATHFAPIAPVVRCP